MITCVNSIFMCFGPLSRYIHIWDLFDRDRASSQKSSIVSDILIHEYLSSILFHTFIYFCIARDDRHKTHKCVLFPSKKVQEEIKF